MKRIIFTLLLVVGFLSFFVLRCEQDKSIPLEQVLFDSQSKPSQALLNLLSALHVMHDGTLEGIVQATQRKWLRSEGKERWEIEDTFKQRQRELYPFFEALSCTQEIKPHVQKYRYGILFGASAFAVKVRLTYVLSLWNQGIRFEKLIVLGSQRPRSEQVEPDQSLFVQDTENLPLKKNWKFSGNYPETEIEIMKFIFDQVELSEEMKKIEIVFIDSAMKQGQDGLLRRPTTQDTLEEWLKTNPEPGTCLLFSNQPYVGYQHMVARAVLPKDFTLETVGGASSQETKVVTYLDTLARWLYNEKLFRDKISKKTD